jgi:pimeloyl-ACP methyl ester carboxylesterase/DNA-binding CsgD family transcriptional regulator
MEHEIRFCTTSDGARIAYAVYGRGPVVIGSPGWVGHLGVMWESPQYRANIRQLGRHFTVVRYDRLGCGLSDRDRVEFTLDAELRTLDAIIRDLGVERVHLYSNSGGGKICVAYAALHPERVSRMALFGCVARGGPSDPALFEAFNSLIRAHWGTAAWALADRFLPHADRPTLEWFCRLQTDSASAEMAIAIRTQTAAIDVTDLARRVRVPTLVLHHRDDRVVPFEMGRELAALIPGARFMPLEGDTHWAILNDTPDLLEAVTSFLGGPALPATNGAKPTVSCSPLTPRELEILRLVAAGRTNREIANDLVLSVRTVERHITNLYAKIEARGKADATAYAIRQGLC